MTKADIENILRSHRRHLKVLKNINNYYSNYNEKYNINKLMTNLFVTGAELRRKLLAVALKYNLPRNALAGHINRAVNNIVYKLRLQPHAKKFEHWRHVTGERRQKRLASAHYAEHGGVPKRNNSPLSRMNKNK